MKILVTIVISVLLFFSCLIGQARAEAPSCAVEANPFDGNNDGVSELLAVNCELTSDGKDRLLIVGVKDYQKQIPWEAQVDYQDGALIFDYGSDQVEDLVIRFSTGPKGELIADLYDQFMPVGSTIPVSVGRDGLVVLSNLNWTLRVIAPDGWWVKDGKINFNLHILVDGPVLTLYATDYLNQLKTDGSIDFELDVTDTNRDGRPDYDLRFRRALLNYEIVSNGTQAMVNYYGDESLMMQQFPAWPYLDLKTTSSTLNRTIKKYQQSPPPLQFDPQTRRLEAIGEFVASRGEEHNCWYYSTVPWVKDEVRDADAESPFCFYDLAQDQDGFPEMQVRMWRWLPNEPVFLDGYFDQPIQWIRYSWSQTATNLWSYAIGLIGTHTVDSIVNILDYPVRTIGYEQFPYWVTENSWKAAAFVDVKRWYGSTEGIYAADISAVTGGDIDLYLAGITEKKPEMLQFVESGIKIDLRLSPMDQPMIYFSPVDYQFHLLGVEKGVWNIDGDQRIEYYDQDQDNYVDDWRYLRQGQIYRQLITTRDTFILSDQAQNTVVFKKGSPLPSLFETLPPRNHTEWLAFGSQVEKLKKDWAPDDFAAMFNQFPGEEFQVKGAVLSDYHRLPQGYRFTLELQPGFSIQGSDWIGLQGKAAGRYVVTFDTAFRVEISSKPQIQFSSAIQLPGDEPPTTYLSYPVYVQVKNIGLEAAPKVTLELGYAQADGTAEWTKSQEIALVGSEEKTVQFSWIPANPGKWTLQIIARLIDSQGEEIDRIQMSREVVVAPAAQTTFQQEVSAFGLIEPWQALILLASLVTLGGIIGWGLFQLAVQEAGNAAK